MPTPTVLPVNFNTTALLKGKYRPMESAELSFASFQSGGRMSFNTNPNSDSAINHGVFVLNAHGSAVVMRACLCRLQNPLS